MLIRSAIPDSLSAGIDWLEQGASRITLALSLLLIINLSLWVTLIFPAWVFVISLFILLMNLRKSNS